MEYASKPAVFDAAVAEVRTSVRAVDVQHAENTVGILEEGKPFSCEFDAADLMLAFKLFSERGRLPILAQQTACRSVWAGARQQQIVGCS
jgi:hypothetical protein